MPEQDPRPEFLGVRLDVTAIPVFDDDLGNEHCVSTRECYFKVAVVADDE